LPNETLEQFLQSAVALLTPDHPLEVRIVAVGVLGSLGDERFTPALLETLQSDSNRQVRHKAAQSLSRIGGDAALEKLHELMFSEDPYTRFLAAESMADIVSRGTNGERQTL
jgi:HEAT repeat protein